MLEGSASKSDWAAIRRCSLTMTVEIWKDMKMIMLMAQMSMSMSRDSTSVSESTGGLASNDSLDHLRSSAEPVGDFEQAGFDDLPAWLNVDLYLQLLHHFADDLVAVRTKVAAFDQIFPNLTLSLYNGGGQVTLLLSEQDVNLVGDNLEGKENAATRLIRVIIAIAF